MVVLLPLVAEDEVVAALQGVEHADRFTLVLRVLELLLQDSGREHVEDDGESAVREASGLFQRFHQHDVRVDGTEHAVELVGLGEGPRIAGRSHGAAAGGEAAVVGARGDDRDHRGVGAQLLGLGRGADLPGHARRIAGGGEGAGVGGDVAAAVASGAFAQLRGQVLGARAVVDVVPEVAQPLTVGEGAQPGADHGSTGLRRHPVQ